MPQMARLENQIQIDANDPVLRFLMAGHVFNGHESLVKRYKLELMEDEPEPWDLAIDVGSLLDSGGVPGLVQQLQQQIGYKVRQTFKIQRMPELNAASLLQAMSEAGKMTCIINLILQSKSIRNYKQVASYKSGIEGFLEGFKVKTGNQAANPFPGRKIVFFLQFRYEEPQEKSRLENKFEAWPLFQDKLLSLTNVLTGDLEFWLEERGIEENPFVRQSLVLRYFEQLVTEKGRGRNADEGFFMNPAQIGMEKIIDLYNNGNKTF